MSDEQVVESPEEVGLAKELGWAPREAWKGPEDQWVDAKTFLERDRGSAARKLLGKVSGLEAELRRQEQARQADRAALAALEASHDEDLKAARADEAARIKAELAAANAAGDHAQVASLTEDLVEIKAAEKAAAVAAAAKADPAGGRRAEIHPEVQAWMDENAAFVRDPERAALANVKVAKMRAAGDKRIGRAILDDAKAEVEAMFGGSGAASGSKVEGSRGGGGQRTSASGKSYSDLPADAKDACDRMAGRLVGTGRAHKDLASWRTSYATKYFSEGA